MKKLLLSGAALVAMSASIPAQAEGLTLDVAGHFKGYGVYVDQDEWAGASLREFDFRKETEVHFTGETTLDNGLTVGAHVELNVDRDDDTNAAAVEESYAYMSGGWGRINFGEEDGAAYLLQVAAPSADSNIDGLRQYINAADVTGGLVALGGITAADLDTYSANLPSFFDLDYDHASSGYSNKFTYMTPVFNGFQAGISYIPSITDTASGTSPMLTDSNAGYDDGYEVAARWEGAFEGVGVALGAGYGRYDNESDADTVAVGEITDARTTWNAGIDLDFKGLGLGVAFLDDTGEADTLDVEDRTWVVGADYQMGAYKLGASYMQKDSEVEATEGDIQRYTVGLTYSYGPGMSFRGSVSHIEAEYEDATGSIDGDGTQFAVGTQINF